MLRSEPSFCIYSEEENIENIELNRTVSIGDNIEALATCGTFSFNKNNMGLIEEDEENDDEDETETTSKPPSRPVSPPMYLATGLGIDDDSFVVDNFDLNILNLDQVDAQEYYKKMLVDYPYHPLLLRNYAQLLQNKGDLCGAEEYYYRATVVDPDDGEMLSLYAKLVWELHHDREKALIYFERAAQVSPLDSHVLAAYANFLWEIGDDDGEEEKTGQEHVQAMEKLQLDDDGNPAFEEVVPTGTDSNSHENIEDYYRRMIEENPDNAVTLSSYAQFLCEFKGDIQGAEEYYSRAMLADPQDGEVKSQYAKLVWDRCHDYNKASSYHEQAVDAAPENSHVLAAYAHFLWETEKDEEKGVNSTRTDHLQRCL